MKEGILPLFDLYPYDLFPAVVFDIPLGHTTVQIMIITQQDFGSRNLRNGTTILKYMDAIHDVIFYCFAGSDTDGAPNRRHIRDRVGGDRGLPAHAGDGTDSVRDAAPTKPRGGGPRPAPQVLR